MTTYTIPKVLAIVAGTAAAAGALLILCSDAVTSGHWTNEEILMPVVVGITIAAGHLTVTAARSLKLLSTVGFAALFVIGTGLTVFNSVGRQALKADTSALETKVRNDLISEKQADLDDAKQRLGNAERAADKERGTKCGPRCRDWEQRATDLRSIVRVLESELRALGAPKPVNAKASRFAEVASIMFGADRVEVEHVVGTMEPFTWSLFLELAAIVSYGYGFGHGPARQSGKNPESQGRKEKSGNPTGPNGGRKVGRPSDPKVLDFIAHFRTRNGRAPTGSEIRAIFPDLPKSTAYDLAARARSTPALRAVA